MRYRIDLSYVGTHYHGWQSQPNASTVQETLEDALGKVFRENISVTGCGRTDTGVHAEYYVAHFDANAETDAMIRTNNTRVLVIVFITIVFFVK